jgi:hypothetical protein
MLTLSVIIVKIVLELLFYRSELCSIVPIKDHEPNHASAKSVYLKATVQSD